MIYININSLIHYIVIKILHRINFNENDYNDNLFIAIFKIISSRERTSIGLNELNH